MNKGKVSQVIGPVIDVDFSEEGSHLPQILNALVIKRKEGDIVLEVQQHLGENRVRAIAMDSTDGVARGLEVIDRGDTIKVPVGDSIRGRLFNVTGDAIDGLKSLKLMNITLSTDLLLDLKTLLPSQKFCLLELR